MPRSRKIRPVSVEELDKIVNQNKIKTIKKPVRMPLLPLRPVKSPAQTRSFHDVFNSTCSNLKGVCNSMRTFADDMDNLITSVEQLAPVVTTVVDGYTRSLKNRERQQLTEKKPEDMTTAEEIKNNTSPIKDNETEQDKVVNTSPNPRNTNVSTNTNSTNTGSNNSAPPKMPSKEEIEQFLSNPLVKSVLQTVLQPKK